jgi:hypothetical protein
MLREAVRGKGASPCAMDFAIKPPFMFLMVETRGDRRVAIAARRAAAV